MAVFKSMLPHPAPDPLVYLNGGPGGPTITLLGPTLGESGLPGVFGNRDIILVDQRGSGLSKPSLACPEISAAVLNNGDFMQAVQACHERLVHEGVDPSDYTTLDAAADVAALGPALGYKSVNLYGISYGTRLALTAMRLFPSRVRGVVLDSVYPPQLSEPTALIESEGHVLTAIMAACAADRYCRTTYPHLAATFSSLVEKLNTWPVWIQASLPSTKRVVDVMLSGDTLWRLIFTTLYSPSNGSVPQMIETASRGGYGLLTKAYGMYLDDLVYSYFGLNISVYCSEDVPFTSPDEITAAAQTLPALLRPGAIAGGLSEQQECQIWHVNPLPAWQKAAVRSSIPTLVLSGQFDPVTPPSYGTLAARTLPHSYVFTFPAQGHGQLFGKTLCPASITTAFLKNPAKRPDASCIANMPPLVFD